MGFLDSLKKALRPLRIDDPFFGSLRYQRAGFWEGKKRLEPLGAEIEVLIDAGDEGPSEAHREFYRQVEARYGEIEPRIEKTLFDELRRWDDGAPAAGIRDEFPLESMDVPRADASPLEWELVYPSKTTGHYFSVSMRDWEPVRVRVDG
jgi:hypothetical protein